VSQKCAACGSLLGDEHWYSAYWIEKGRRVVLCRVCLGEIFFNVLPLVTGPTKNTPRGSGSPNDDDLPGQSNAIRKLEGD